MPIYDEELLKKENITIENSTKEFNNYLEKISNLKNKVENEILKLDELTNFCYNLNYMKKQIKK